MHSVLHGNGCDWVLQSNFSALQRPLAHHTASLKQLFRLAAPTRSPRSLAKATFPPCSIHSLTYLPAYWPQQAKAAPQAVWLLI